MPIDRREAINQTIQSRGEIHLSELAELFPDVSSMTLRRDLESLERQGLVVRTRGGGKVHGPLSMIKEAAYTQRQVTNATPRWRSPTSGPAGRGRALDLHRLRHDLHVFCPAPIGHQLFVLTPAPNIALELAKNANIKVNLTGGQLNRETLTLTGFNATEYVKSLNIDYAFMAASAFSPDSGFSCGDYYEAELKRLIIRKASTSSC
jgi:DeoR/GlpR family transcriptional regulator of sugar metabolism